MKLAVVQEFILNRKFWITSTPGSFQKPSPDVTLDRRDPGASCRGQRNRPDRPACARMKPDRAGAGAFAGGARYCVMGGRWTVARLSAEQCRDGAPAPRPGNRTRRLPAARHPRGEGDRLENVQERKLVPVVPVHTLFWAERFSLFSSRLGKEDSAYTPEVEYGLA
jgi:hypothetical protein